MPIVLTITADHPADLEEVWDLLDGRGAVAVQLDSTDVRLELDLTTGAGDPDDEELDPAVDAGEEAPALAAVPDLEPADTTDVDEPAEDEPAAAQDDNGDRFTRLRDDVLIEIRRLGSATKGALAGVTGASVKDITTVIATLAQEGLIETAGRNGYKPVRPVRRAVDHDAARKRAAAAI